MVSLVPFGGFVKLLGEDKEEEIEPELKNFSYHSKTALQKILIIFGGPLFNLLFAVIVFSFLFMKGVPVLQPYIGGVQKGLPAEHAGLKPGDRIIRIAGFEIKSWDDVSRIISESKGDFLNISVLRDNKIVKVTLKPKIREYKNIFGEKKQRYFIGIYADTNKYQIIHYNPVYSFWLGTKETGKWIKLTFLSIVKIIERVIPLNTIGGPILIGQIAGQQAKAGAANFLFFLAMISVNLGVLNLLPIPILDGGHIVIITLEAIRGKEIDIKKIEFIQKVGLSFILILMFFAFYNDILRLIRG
jgi:regulator of sigma E protease